MKKFKIEKAIFAIAAVFGVGVFLWVSFGEKTCEPPEAAHRKVVPAKPAKPAQTEKNVQAIEGPPSEEDIVFEEKHKDKDRIYLLDNYTIELYDDYSYTETRHEKVKILKEDAKDLGEIPLYYDASREEYVKIEAYTITPDGKKHRYTKIQDLNLYPDYNMYSEWRTKVVTMPKVNIGSIIELRAVLHSKGKPMPNAFWDEVYFAYANPTRKAAITYKLPKSLDIDYKEFNVEYKPKITEDEKTITYFWEFENMLYEGKQEDFEPPPRVDFIENAVEFSSIKKWSDISDWYFALIEKNTKLTPGIKNAAAEVFKDAKTIKDKARRLIEYMSENFRYVSMSFGNNALEPHPTSEVFENRYGDCKDLSLLARALLKLGGVDSELALFRNEFEITDPRYDLPMPRFFDHVLLLVKDPEGDFYIDPVLDDFDVEVYPPYYQRAYTFVINDKGGEFRRFPEFDEKRNYEKSIYRINISADGSADTKSIKWNNLDDSIYLRNMYERFGEEKMNEYRDKAFLSSHPNGEMLERDIEGLDDKYGIIKTFYHVTDEELYPVKSDMMFIEISGYSRGMEFTDKERKLPIFCPANLLSEEIVIYNLPDEFRIEYLPPNLNFDNGLFCYSREYKRTEGKIEVCSKLRFKRGELPAEEYKNVQDFYAEIAKKSDQMIILKKKKPFWEELKDITRRFRR